jgi:hypothetical protein
LNEEYESRKVKILKNRRVLEVEGENDPRSTNEDCERLKTGDYCFKNNTSSNLILEIFKYRPNVAVNLAFRSLVVKRGQNACMFNVPASPYYFHGGKRLMSREIIGNIKVEKCKSLTYTFGEGRSVKKSGNNRRNNP